MCPSLVRHGSQARVRAATNPAKNWKGLSDWEPSDKVRYASTFQPPHPSTGTTYPGAYSSLTTLLNGASDPVVVHASAIKHKAWIASDYGAHKTLEYATSRLEKILLDDSLKPSSDCEPAFRRLRSLNHLRVWGPDIVFKAFNDLDTALFGGVLKDRVRLRWQTAAQMAESASCDLHNHKTSPGKGCTCYGTTWWKRRGVKFPSPSPSPSPCCQTQTQTTTTTTKNPNLTSPLKDKDKDNKDKEEEEPYRGISIDLNSTSIFLSPLPLSPLSPLSLSSPRSRSRYSELWATLIHEMTHAYFQVSVDPHSRAHMWSEHDRDHGTHFWRVLEAVNERCEGAGLGGDVRGVCEGGCWGEGDEWECEGCVVRRGKEGGQEEVWKEEWDEEEEGGNGDGGWMGREGWMMG
ncbi:hypothetical protein MMC14_004759 [Varicellaria rhodocarpa]|nr:hypothetical protein [Varicellaria rhodocarpa]